MGHRFGRYESIRAIASGGMASVHLARSVGEGGFERLVAVKAMHPHIAEDPDFRAMFLDEARLAARIRHPNVVGVIDVQTTEEGMFLVMEYVDGPSLHELRREFHKGNTTLPIGITLRIFVDVLTGLHDAHELTDNEGQPLRLIHRDVSPQNILVGKDGVTRITDFGVARAEARLSQTHGGQLKGKIAYMCPEQIRSGRVDRRADVYSVGAAMWEALTGRRLFRSESDAGLVHLIFAGAPHTPHELNEEVPTAISELCMRALSLDRTNRPSTAADFADALEDAAAASGLRIASQRQLAAFVRGLPAALREPTELRVALPSAPTVDEIMPIPAVIDRSESEHPSGISALTGPKAMVTSRVTARPSLRSTPWLAAGAVGALVVGAMVAVSVLTSGASIEEAHHAAQPPSASVVEIPPPEPILEPPTAPSPSASGSGDRSPDTHPAPPPVSQPRTTRPAPEPKTNTSKPKGPKFLPKDL